MKCNVPLEDLELDAYALVPALDKLSDDPGNRFTDYDVACALSAYGSNDLRFWKNEYMCRRAKIAPHENKHNGRTREQHVKVMKLFVTRSILVEIGVTRMARRPNATRYAPTPPSIPKRAARP